jgi:hypothetical protein
VKILIAAQEYYFISDSIKRIMENNTHHEFMIVCDHISSHTLDDVDFILDPIFIKEKSVYLYKKCGVEGYGNPKTVNILKEDIFNFKPDIVLSNSQIVTRICQKFNYNTFYFSSKYSYGSVWWRKAVFETKYKESFFDISEEISKSNKKNERIISYTPILNIENINYKNNPIIKTIFPYHLRPIENNDFNFKFTFPISDPTRDINIVNLLKDKDIAFLSYKDSLVDNKKIFDLKDSYTYRKLLYSCDYFISDGNTSYLTDALMCGKKIIVSPSINSVEAKVNANILEKEEVAPNIGQIENMEHYASEYFDKSVNINFNYKMGKCKNELFNL